MAISKLQHRFTAGERLSAGKLNAPLDKIDELVEETNKFDGVADALESLSPDQSGALKLSGKVNDLAREKANTTSYYSTMGSGSSDCIAPRGNAVAQTIGSGTSAKDATKKIVRLKGKTERIEGDNPRLINTNAVGIRTTDTYGDEHYVDIDAKRVVDSEGNLLFPEGLQGVGNVQDEFTPTKATARMKKARLADLSWTYYNGRFFAQIADAKRVTTYPYGDNTNAVCSLYPIDSSTTSTQNDKTIRVNQGNDTSGYMYIRDTDYTDTPSFVAHIGDAELVYELDTPIEIDLAHPLNLTYPVSKGGVEEAVYEGEAGLPIEADVIEGGSVVEAIEQTPISQQAWAILMADKMGISADKVGYVDMGMLSWIVNGKYFSSYVSNGGSTDVQHCLCSKYQTTNGSTWDDVKAGQIGVYSSQVRLIDTSYTDAAALKASLAGIYLFYEKA